MFRIRFILYGNYGAGTNFCTPSGQNHCAVKSCFCQNLTFMVILAIKTSIVRLPFHTFCVFLSD